MLNTGGEIDREFGSVGRGPGALTHIYQFKTDQDNEIKTIFEIDFSNRKIYIVTELGDIRIYLF